MVCEELRSLLELEKREKQKLLDSILEFSNQNILDREHDRTKKDPEPSNLQPVPSNFVPWRVRQQILEAEDRRKAELINEHKLNQANLLQNRTTERENDINKKNEELEKELGIQ